LISSPVYWPDDAERITFSKNVRQEIEDLGTAEGASPTIFEVHGECGKLGVRVEWH